jgi:methionyl-tRNA synthetase
MTKSFIGEKWRKWWQPDEKNVELCQFMGKDNIVFHSIITPAAFFANGQSWVFPRRLSVT